MDHGGEAARPIMVESTDFGMAAAVHGREAHNMTSATFNGQLGAAAARRASFVPTVAAYQSYPEFARHVSDASTVPVAVFHREPGPGVVCANMGASWRQLGAVDALLVGPDLPDGVVQVHDSSFYSALQPGPAAGRGVALAALLPGGVGAVHNGDYALQLRPGDGHGEVHVDLLPNGAGVVYNNYMWQPSPAAGHGEVFVGLLPCDADAVYDDYGYYAWQPRPGAGRGEVSIGPLLPDGVGAVFDNSSNCAQHTLPATARAHVIAGALGGRNLGAGYDGSGALAGAAYNNLGMVDEHLRPLLPFVGIGACSVAVNGLATGPGSPAVAFHLFALLLGGLFLVILHVLRV